MMTIILMVDVAQQYLHRQMQQMVMTIATWNSARRKHWLVSSPGNSALFAHIGSFFCCKLLHFTAECFCTLLQFIIPVIPVKRLCQKLFGSVNGETLQEE
jgi:hypothetical protein